MQNARTFKVVWVAPGRGVGGDESAADLTVTYRGRAVTVKPPQ